MMSEVCVVVEFGSRPEMQPEHWEAQREHKMYFEWVSGDSPRKTAQTVKHESRKTN